jgi:hypothetical protein
MWLKRTLNYPFKQNEATTYSLLKQNVDKECQVIHSIKMRLQRMINSLLKQNVPTKHLNRSFKQSVATKNAQ